MIDACLIRRYLLGSLVLVSCLAWTRPASAGTFEIRQPRVHATDCTSLTNGRLGDLCFEQDSNRLFVCDPSAGACDTPAEWVLPPSTGTVAAAAPLQFTGTAPTIVACGTTPSIVGTMMSGTVTVGVGPVTICELTFPSAWANKPPCVASNESQPILLRTVATTTTLTFLGADFGGDVINYVCGGFQ